MAGSLLVLAACGSGSGPSDADADADDAGGPLIATAADRGSFSVPCAYSHSAEADPIVHPGHTGTGHHHDFFGATTTGASSTVESLLAGDTTCRSVGDKTAYWAPQLRAGGTPVRPTEVVAYYRAPVGADARAVQPLPNGLEMIAGDAAATTAQDAGTARWSCGPAGRPSAVPVRCPAEAAPLQLTLTFPPCWDGANLASPDHRSHLAPLPAADEADRADAIATCPSDHPVLLPEVTVEVRYAPGPPAGELTLASGPVTGGHGDVLVAWDARALTGEIDACVRRNVRCDVP